jgi:hypothetical protein
MLHATVGRYSIALATSPELVSYGERTNAVVKESFVCDGDERSYLAVGLSESGCGPELLVEGWFSPGPSSGFFPSVLVAPDTGVAFIGAGSTALCFSLAPIAKLAHEQVEAGFWNWHLHGKFVLMSAELEFAVWSTSGKKLWSRFVEPPWHFTTQEELIVLEVMGHQQIFNLLNGEPHVA